MTQHKDLDQLTAQLATLEARLNKGFEMSGDAVDDLFVKLLAEYEATYDQLKAAGRV